MVLCPICQKENGEILLDRMLKDSLERFTVTADPCDTCKKQYLKTGTLLLEQSGRLVVIKDEAFTRIFGKTVPRGKVAFVEEGVLDKLEMK